MLAVWFRPPSQSRSASMRYALLRINLLPHIHSITALSGHQWEICRTPSPERRNAKRRPHRKGYERRANLLDPRRYTDSMVRGRKRASASYFPLRFACKLRIYESRPAWTRTRNLFLIRETRHFAGGFQSLQNSCKQEHSLREAFLSFRFIRLGCCTRDVNLVGGLTAASSVLLL